MLRNTACAILCTVGLSFGIATAQTFVPFDYSEARSTSALGIDAERGVAGRLRLIRLSRSHLHLAIGVNADRGWSAATWIKRVNSTAFC